MTHGKTWRAICDVAGEIDAVTIVLGARGLSRVGSLLLGSVSSAVLVHAKRPVLVVPHHGGGLACRSASRAGSKARRPAAGTVCGVLCPLVAGADDGGQRGDARQVRGVPRGCGL